MNISYEIECLMITLPDYTKKSKTLEFREKSKKVREFIKENMQYEITGLWYLTALTYDDAPQLIIRTTKRFSTYDKLVLHGKIFDIFFQDVIYSYEDDVVGHDGMIIGLQNELIEEIRSGRVLTIYDENREHKEETQ